MLEAAAVGTARMRQKMAEAVALSKISGTTRVDEALGTAATYGRFATGDLASLLEAGTRGPAHRADETRSLAQGTSGWAAIGQGATPTFEITEDETEQSA